MLRLVYFLLILKENDMLCIYRSICNMYTNNRLIRLTDGYGSSKL